MWEVIGGVLRLLTASLAARVGVLCFIRQPQGIVMQTNESVVQMNINVRGCVYIHIHIHVHMYVSCIYIYIFLYIKYVHMHIYIYIYIHIYRDL